VIFIALFKHLLDIKHLLFSQFKFSSQNKK